MAIPHLKRIFHSADYLLNTILLKKKNPSQLATPSFLSKRTNNPTGLWIRFYFYYPHY